VTRGFERGLGRDTTVHATRDVALRQRGSRP
jgi:hypothetical protein